MNNDPTRDVKEELQEYRNKQQGNQPIPEKGSRWVHKNGNSYQVLLVANLESTRPEYPLTVVYEGDNGRIWARPLSRWYESMSPV